MNFDSILDLLFYSIGLFFLVIACIFCISLFQDYRQDLEVEHCIEFYDEHNNYVLDGCEVYIEKYKENLKGSE